MIDGIMITIENICFHTNNFHPHPLFLTYLYHSGLTLCAVVAQHGTAAPPWFHPRDKVVFHLKIFVFELSGHEVARCIILFSPTGAGSWYHFFSLNLAEGEAPGEDADQPFCLVPVLRGSKGAERGNETSFAEQRMVEGSQGWEAGADDAFIQLNGASKGSGSGVC